MLWENKRDYWSAEQYGGGGRERVRNVFDSVQRRDGVCTDGVTVTGVFALVSRVPHERRLRAEGEPTVARGM